MVKHEFWFACRKSFLLTQSIMRFLFLLSFPCYVHQSQGFSLCCDWVFFFWFVSENCEIRARFWWHRVCLVLCGTLHARQKIILLNCNIQFGCCFFSSSLVLVVMSRRLITIIISVHCSYMQCLLCHWMMPNLLTLDAIRFCISILFLQALCELWMNFVNIYK